MFVPLGVHVSFSNEGIASLNRFSYMLRYLKAVQMVKAIIEENDLVSITALYSLFQSRCSLHRKSWRRRRDTSVPTRRLPRMIGGTRA